jgi:asparagine synthase (glutamine-hydrolysing)
MVSPSGRYIIVFNGEIYNHMALREELAQVGQSFSWRGQSDTETLLACIESWGLQRTLKRAIGMFAFGLWDREERRLSLARDRFGEKPLYYGIHGGNLIFCSELKSLAKFEGFERRIDRGALAQFLRYGYVPGPYSIWTGVQKLPPGTVVTASPDLAVSSPVAYWSFAEAAVRGESDPVFLSDADATEALDSVLRLAVRGQMAADVPLGALLSGGVDSSTVASLMQDLSDRPIKTFCIGFEESEFDESGHANEVARHLGTDHTQMRITSSDVQALVPMMASVYDEPFADPSQLPTCLVMSLARRHVTVALSGDAADELFGGYARYFAIPRIWASLAWMGLSGRLMA